LNEPGRPAKGVLDIGAKGSRAFECHGGMRLLGSMASSAEISITLRLKAGLTFFPHACSMFSIASAANARTSFPGLATLSARLVVAVRRFFAFDAGRFFALDLRAIPYSFALKRRKYKSQGEPSTKTNTLTSADHLTATTAR
jgi:hypothetical protein